jgi:uncharacterized protein (TIGR02466 family)
MNNNFSVTPLFSIPFCRCNIGYIPDDIRKIIVNLEYERTPADTNFYSVNKYVLEIEELKILKNKIMDQVNNFVYDVLDVKDNMKFNIENSWVNKHHKGDSSPEHYHGNSLISGVFYLDADENSGAISFFKDKTHYNLWTETVRVDFNYQDPANNKTPNFYNAQSIEFFPQKNDLILFPSILNHEVSANRSETVRYSLAFNLFPRGTAGGPINSITV